MIIWQFICDIILLIEGLLGVFWALIYLIILLKHNTCRKSPMVLLVGNTSFAGLLFHTVVVCQAIYMLIDRPEVFCILRGHLIHAFVGAVYHSICLQALHRLFVIVFSSRSTLQCPKTLIIMVIIQWIFSLTFCLPKVNPYPMISDICLGPFHRRYVFIHLSIAVYLLPTTLLIIIYTTIFCYIRKKTSAYVLQSTSPKHRLHREVSILRRIIIPVFIMLLTGLPLAIFFIQGQFSLKTPEYAVRMAIIFLTAGTALAMLINLIFTDSIRQHLSYEKYFLIPVKVRIARQVLSYQQESISLSLTENDSKKHTIIIRGLET